MFGTRNRVAGDEMHPFGNMRSHLRHDRALGGAHVRQNRARLQMRRDGFRHFFRSADRHADDHQIRILHRVRCREAVSVPKPQLFRTGQRRRRAGRDGDGLRQALFADDAGEGGADEADADQGNALKMGI